MKKLMMVAAVMAAVVAEAREVDLAAIVWPAYQDEPRWKEMGIFAHGCGEWQNVYEGVPKKPDHYQPMKPYWGYGRDDDPKEMARQIDAALAAGINVFIYDWYWYHGRPFLENALNKGFLGAPNNERMKFYLMYADHHVDSIWDNTIADKSDPKINWRVTVTMDEFCKVLVPRWIEYFKRPNYYKIDGEPVFWLYWQPVMEEVLGGQENLKKALDCFVSETKRAGFPGLHLQCHMPFPSKWDRLEPLPWNLKPTIDEWCAYFGYKSGTYYHCLNAVGKWMPQGKDMDYETFVGDALKTYDAYAKRGYKTPLFPNLTTGWDNNARYPKECYTYRVLGNTPEKFEEYLRQIKEWSERNVKGRKLIVLNAWNEWTEGCYLQPDEKFGYGFLNAVSRVFCEK